MDRETFIEQHQKLINWYLSSGVEERDICPIVFSIIGLHNTLFCSRTNGMNISMRNNTLYKVSGRKEFKLNYNNIFN